jgi:hypothetical protein
MKSSTAKEVQFQSPSSQKDCKVYLKFVAFECVSVVEILKVDVK